MKTNIDKLFAIYCDVKDLKYPHRNALSIDAFRKVIKEYSEEIAEEIKSVFIEIDSTDEYVISGTESDYIVRRISDKRFICDCPLFNKINNCHHVKTVKLRKMFNTLSKEKYRLIKGGTWEVYSVDEDRRTISTCFTEYSLESKFYKGTEVYIFFFGLLLYGWSISDIKKEYDIDESGNKMFDKIVRGNVTEEQYSSLMENYNE